MASPVSLQTNDPVALRYLMTETLFGMGEDAFVQAAASAEQPVAAQEPVAAAPKPPQAPSFLFFGSNKRHYLFLTNDMNHDWMSAAALDAFTKTLAALKLSTDDIALLNIGKLPSVPEKVDVVAFFKPKVVVSLGIALPWGGGDDPSVRIFQTHSFDEMLVDAEKKRIFWTTVKTLLI